MSFKGGVVLSNKNKKARFMTNPRIVSQKPSLTKQVRSVKKTIRRIQNEEELKYKDTYLNGTSLSATPVVTLLNGLILGDDVSNRQGDDITATSIQFRAFFWQAATTAGSDSLVRHLIIWDSQANGAAPSAGDILDAATITPLVLSPYKRQYQKRFKIVYDNSLVLKPQVVDPANPTTEIVVPYVHKRFKKALHRVVKYRNAQNTGLITDIASNSLYSVLIASQSGVAATIGYRLYYKDD